MNENSTRAVDALVAHRLLDPTQRELASRVVDEALAAPARNGLPMMVEVVAYVGSALVLAAGSLFFNAAWGDLGLSGRSALLGVVTVILLLAGGVVATSLRRDASPGGGAHDGKRRLAGVLLTGGAVVTAFLVGLVVDHAGDFDGVGAYWPSILGAAAGVVVGAVGYRFAPTVLALVGMAFGASLAAGQSVEVLDDRYVEVGGAVVLLVVAGVWLVLTELGAFATPTPARALGVTIALIGAQFPLFGINHNGLTYALTAGLAVLSVVVYLERRDWPYLAVAVGAVTLVVPEAVSDWTGDSLGAIGAVLLTGVTLLLASFAGYRLRAGTTAPN